VDASRLSRNSKDWAQLFELCGYFDTLVADGDQIYDLSYPNDRLVLGIKGTISEMELRNIRQRLWTGLESKAQRGELLFNLSAGYVHDPEGRMVLDPDQRVQQAIQVLFDQFDRCTSVRQLSLWYRDTGNVLPVQPAGADRKVIWQVPRSRTLFNMLLHPIYAGAYVWGRRTTQVEYIEGELVKRTNVKRPAGEALVCIRDHHPAYITWERHLAIREKIAQNRPRWKMDDNLGAIREGLALLCGLLRCGRCGRKIYVQYKASSALYSCDGGDERMSRRCGAFGSQLIDQRVSEELLRACSPLGIEAAERALSRQEDEQSAVLESGRLQVQAAQYEADRAFEQFDRCDPKNRLVADTLEQRPNEKLVRLEEAKKRLAALSKEKESLTEIEREKVRSLSGNLPLVWNHSKADPKLKKRLLRAAIHEVVVKTNDEHRRLDVVIHWKGGVHTPLEVPRPFRARGGAADGDLKTLVSKLARELSDAEIARILNMKEAPTPRGLKWTQDRVSSFRHQHGIPAGDHRKPADVLTLSEARGYLGVGHSGMVALVRRGLISPNQVTEFAPWRVSRAELDSDRVRAVVKVQKETGRLPPGGCPEGQGRLFQENPEESGRV
jgi:hypothetical protein